MDNATAEKLAAAMNRLAEALEKQQTMPASVYPPYQPPYRPPTHAEYWSGSPYITTSKTLGGS